VIRLHPSFENVTLRKIDCSDMIPGIASRGQKYASLDLGCATPLPASSVLMKGLPLTFYITNIHRKVCSVTDFAA
jgi:hypothetical protein